MVVLYFLKKYPQQNCNKNWPQSNPWGSAVTSRIKQLWSRADPENSARILVDFSSFVEKIQRILIILKTPQITAWFVSLEREDLSSTGLDLTSIWWSQSVNFRWLLMGFYLYFFQNAPKHCQICLKICKTLQKQSISVDFCQAPKIIRWLSNQIE